MTADAMTRDAKTVPRHATLRELGELFEKDFNAYPVEENSQVVGVVSKFDYLANFVFTPTYMIPRYEDLMERTVADIMTSEFIYVRDRNEVDQGSASHGRSSAQEHAGDRGRSAAHRRDLA
jgi:CBS-domain-containing membrane protein